MTETALEPATFEVGETHLEFQRIPASEGNDGVAIGSLLKETGLVTVDPGFMNTASCTSEITYIDGDAGVLRYRGYPIDQLAKSSSFLEVAYLLVHGELPNAAELGAFVERVERHTHLHENFRNLIGAFPRDAHPMAILSSAVSALPGYYPESVDPFDPARVELATVLLLAKAPTIAAYAHRHSLGQEMIGPEPSLGYVGDFLRMCFADGGEYEPSPSLAEALNLLLVLHADHEQNCSTSTVRIVGSAHANLYASVSAGINALSGPLHGGANEAVLEMLRDIRESDDDVDTFMKRVKNKDKGVRLMGFGHRVYKNYDPRAAIVKSTADRILSELGKRDEMLDIAMRLEEIALSDSYFIERKLYPNVDFYTGLIYKAMGFPTTMFTPLFAVGRMPGWIAQWREMMNDPTTKIGRPRQVYTGHTDRDYVELDAR
ncbi:citrate synthase I [Beutenbergia cavernae DSM 12333]|uniref:Citrate synthase n=1 Tax=Beutenbergia cavernae (strain ATCC BAA-8 / DSM 12333 / CCUG 43141 / JCM 11478 / NBRC 16432 / NCIMB 13614 / HKI 0122) TaxID=471853 RepID=C5C0Y6_BEUC1|nr:citrate synthase [Beutenbergia cavernae]ACQ79390.1 citrate synthase I [Beutenbergia cavernae DSM 12333]